MHGRHLVVAGLLLLGAALPLWAAPFTEVPAEHWAYGACTRLTAVGMLPSDRAVGFSGDPSLTRFEFGIAILEPLSVIDGALTSLPPDADARTRFAAVADAFRLSARLSEDEISRGFTDLRRLSREFRDVLEALNFDADPSSRALAALADTEPIHAWRRDALVQPSQPLALAGGSVGAATVELPFAHGTVALSLTAPPEPPELLDYLARSAASLRGQEGRSPAGAEPALADPRVSRLRTAYEYGLGSALTLNLAYEEIARRGQGLAALDVASLTSVGIGYRLTPSTSLKLSYSLLEYSNYLFDTPPLRDHLAETAVSVEF